MLLLQRPGKLDPAPYMVTAQAVTLCRFGEPTLESPSLGPF